MIGVASTAPGYSLAAVPGLIVAIEGVGVQAPAVMIAAFVPILFVATAYRYLNRATRTAARPSRGRRGPSAPRRAGWICVIGELNARTQRLLLTAAIAFGGPDHLAGDESGDVLGPLGEDVFGSALLGKLPIIAVLASAAASTQTTIPPTARTTLSMARAGALPARLGKVHPEYLTPHVSTILMEVLSVVWYVGLTIISADILSDSIAALGLMIAFYYGLTGFACTFYFRRELTRSARSFALAGVLPFVGGLMLLGVFVKSVVDLSDPANSTAGTAWIGLGPPVVIGMGFLLMGPVLMLLWRATGHGAFFTRRPETAPPGLLDAPDRPPV